MKAVPAVYHGQAAQPVPLASLQLRMAVYG